MCAVMVGFSSYFINKPLVLRLSCKWLDCSFLFTAVMYIGYAFYANIYGCVLQVINSLHYNEWLGWLKFSKTLNINSLLKISPLRWSSHRHASRCNAVIGVDLNVSKTILSDLYWTVSGLLNVLRHKWLYRKSSTLIWILLCLCIHLLAVVGVLHILCNLKIFKYLNFLNHGYKYS